MLTTRVGGHTPFYIIFSTYTTDRSLPYKENGQSSCVYCHAADHNHHKIYVDTVATTLTNIYVRTLSLQHVVL